MSAPARPSSGSHSGQGTLSLLDLTWRSGGAFALQVLGVGLAYVTQVMLARWMGAEDYGAYALVVTWMTLLATAVGLGFPSSSLRFLAEYQAEQEWALLRGVMRTFPGITLAAGIVLAGLGAVLFLALPELGGKLRTAFLLGFALIPFYGLATLLREMTRALGWAWSSQGPEKVGRPLAVLLGAGLIFVIRGGLTAEAAVVATLAALATVVLIQTLTLRRAQPPPARHALPRTKLRLWLRVSLPSLLAAGFVLLMGQMDILMIGFLRPTADVGLYNAATKIATLVTFVLYAVNVVVVPRFAALYAAGDGTGLQRLVAQVAHLCFWPSLAMTGVLVVLARPVLGMFGTEFQEARLVLVVLALCQLFNTAVGPVGYLLIMTGHQDDNAVGLALAAAANLVFNSLAIPRFGILGAAGATTLAWVLLGLWLHRIVRRKVGVGASIVSALLLRRSPSCAAS